jgi:hypothetical protein
MKLDSPMTATKTCLGAGMLKSGQLVQFYGGESNIDLLCKMPDHMLPIFATMLMVSRGVESRRRGKVGIVWRRSFLEPRCIFTCSWPA